MTRKGKAQGANSLLIFCLVVDVVILAAMVLIALFTKTAWCMVLILAMQKPEYEERSNITARPHQPEGVDNGQV